ncbi:hypothetical protein [Methylocapsa palsarum]|uniref:hypothetical protein n=1 Tax=Methylocapsa palsarum TaxID=1612308 RepID=UPI0011142865|nr:hypothetical protein [Methylocapsa palsarum]
MTIEDLAQLEKFAPGVVKNGVEPLKKRAEGRPILAAADGIKEKSSRIKQVPPLTFWSFLHRIVGGIMRGFVVGPQTSRLDFAAV